MTEKCFIKGCGRDADYYIKPTSFLEAHGFTNTIKVALGLADYKPVCEGHNEYIVWSREIKKIEKDKNES